MQVAMPVTLNTPASAKVNAQGTLTNGIEMLRTIIGLNQCAFARDRYLHKGKDRQHIE